MAMKATTTWICGRRRLAEVLGMSENTVRRMELDGLPHYKPRGGQVLYDLSEVEDYLRATRVNRGTLTADLRGGGYSEGRSS